MKVIRSSLLEGAPVARGTAVVVDVFRAFSCTPCFFPWGYAIRYWWPRRRKPRRLKAQDEELILIGEVGGVPVEGFDLGNSPSQILRRGADFFKGKAVVQRTSAGVRGPWRLWVRPMKCLWEVLWWPGPPRAI